VEHISTLHLDSAARPLALQSCAPRNACRFVASARAGVLVRVHDVCIDPMSNYKSIVIAGGTTCAQAVRMLLQRSSHSVDEYAADTFVIVKHYLHSGGEWCDVR
jgi:hypothetical protein